jgi:type IV secretion system protein VirB4
LPNDRALEPKIRQAYEKLGLNERQLQILATATPKQQYYYQSRLGNRLFNLTLGPIALAFCAMSRPEDKTMIKNLLAKVGQKDFLEHYLNEVQLSWAFDLVRKG